MGRYKRALVTGGAGFIGSHIVRALLERGIEVVVLDDLSVGRRENLPGTEVELVEGSILDPGAVRSAARGAEVVFHNAARVSIRSSFDGAAEDAEANVVGTVNVLKAAGRAGVKRFINASSMAVYSTDAPVPLTESAPLTPASPYGVSKLAAEHYTRLLSAHYGFDALTLRYFNTFGPRQGFTPYVGVITIFITELLKKNQPTVLGDGAQKRDFIHVEDVAGANLLAMDSDVTGAAINVGTGTGTTVNTVAAMLAERIAPEIAPVFGPAPEGEPRDSVADTRLAERALGFHAESTLAGRIQEVINEKMEFNDKT